MIVVADTSPLHYLILIRQIELLPALFGHVLAPPAVGRELSHEHAPSAVRMWIADPPSWFSIRAPISKKMIPGLGAGEIEALALVVESPQPLLLVDERGARKAAARQGIPVLGTVGVLELAAAHRRIDLAVQIAALRSTNYQIADSILKDALERQANRKQQNP